MESLDILLNFFAKKYFLETYQRPILEWQSFILKNLVEMRPKLSFLKMLKPVAMIFTPFRPFASFFIECWNVVRLAGIILFVFASHGIFVRLNDNYWLEARLWQQLTISLLVLRSTALPHCFS